MTMTVRMNFRHSSLSSSAAGVMRTHRLVTMMMMIRIGYLWPLVRALDSLTGWWFPFFSAFFAAVSATGSLINWARIRSACRQSAIGTWMNSRAGGDEEFRKYLFKFLFWSFYSKWTFLRVVIKSTLRSVCLSLWQHQQHLRRRRRCKTRRE